MSSYPAPGTYPASGSYPSSYAGAATELTITVTPEPASVPPRVRIDIADTRGTPITQVTVTRRDPDGHRWPVRTADAGPQPVSGGIATLFDYEAPYGQQVTYSTDVPGLGPVDALLDVPDVWLIDPGVPSRSQPVHVTKLGARTRPTGRTQFAILGRRDPLAVSAGARGARQSTVMLRTTTDGQVDALDLLFDNDSPLLLNIPPAKPWGWDSCYVSVGDLVEDRTVAYGRFPWREWTLPVTVVARPAGGTQAGITWTDDAAQYTSWQAIVDAGVTSWAELAAPTV